MPNGQPWVRDGTRASRTGSLAGGRVRRWMTPPWSPGGVVVEPERNWRAAVGARRPEGKRDRCGRWRPVGAGKWDPHKPLAKGSSAIQPRLPRTQRQEGSAAYATCGERTAATPKSAFEVCQGRGACRYRFVETHRPTLEQIPGRFSRRSLREKAGRICLSPTPPKLDHI